MIVLPVSLAQAQTGPEPGCFERVYTPAHLAAHPDQVVARMVLQILDFKHDYGTDRVANMAVWTADQGHAAAAGKGNRRFDQILICWKGDDGAGCSVECDGGWFTVVKQDDSGLTFETTGLVVGDTEDEGCGGNINIAERIGQPVRYRLDTAEPRVCTAAFPPENGQ